MDAPSARVRNFAADRTSGASALLETALSILEAALTSQLEVLPIARALVQGQPTMAPIWAAAIEAVATLEQAGRFDRFAARARRAPAALTRTALQVIADEATPAHFVTLSYSGAVLRAVQAAAARRPVRISCAEGRPALEGRRLAETLAAAGIPVTHYSDAGIADALAPATAVLVGADAIGADRFLNKVGTRMLAAAAATQGIPVYVLATRDKFIDAAVLARLSIREGHADEIWPDPPAGVAVRNPYFEATPLDLVAAVVTDAGVIATPDVAAVCAASLDDVARRAFERLTSG